MIYSIYNFFSKLKNPFRMNKTTTNHRGRFYFASCHLILGLVKKITKGGQRSPVTLCILLMDAFGAPTRRMFEIMGAVATSMYGLFEKSELMWPLGSRLGGRGGRVGASLHCCVQCTRAPSDITRLRASLRLPLAIATDFTSSRNVYSSFGYVRLYKE